MLTQRDLQALIQQAQSSDSRLLPASSVIYARNSIDFAHDVKQLVSGSGYCVIKATSKKECDYILHLLEGVVGPRFKQNSSELSTEVAVTPVLDESRYINNRSFQPLHTDNAYTLNEPKTIALVCQQPAEKGGESLIVSVNSVVDYFKSNNKEVIELLSEPNAISYFSNASIVGKTVFQKHNGDYYISFSTLPQRILFKSDRHQSLFIELLAYIHSPSNQHCIKLEINDVLLISNHHALHGRTQFFGNRKLIRIWYSRSLM